MFKRVIILIIIFTVHTSITASEFTLQAETGAVWFSKNNISVPGDTGSRFDMMELTGSGPDPYMRLYATYDFNDRHALRITFAPLQVEGTGLLEDDVLFGDDTFSAGTPIKGTYKFNTYRLTYRWNFHNTDKWLWGVGGALLVRDAKISLEQGATVHTEDDLGLVPLVHFYGAHQFNSHTSAIMDIEGAWSPMGRAIDAAFKIQYELDSRWHIAAGYRTLEGGADNNEIYTFAWLHYAMAEIGYRF